MRLLKRKLNRNYLLFLLKVNAISPLVIVCLKPHSSSGPDDVSKTSCTTLESIGSKIQDKAVAVSLIMKLEFE